MLQKRTFIMLAVASVAGVAMLPSAADAQFVRSGAPDVSFKASGPAGFKIEGKTSDLSVVDGANTLSVTVPLVALATGIELRDRHMREKYLEVQKYPQAELSVPRASLKIPTAGQETSDETQGTLRLHGQTHPVKFNYRAKRSGDSFAVQGTMRVNMNEYGINVPSYLGITVKPEVEVAVKFDAVDKR